MSDMELAKAQLELDIIARRRQRADQIHQRYTERIPQFIIPRPASDFVRDSEGELESSDEEVSEPGPGEDDLSDDEPTIELRTYAGDASVAAGETLDYDSDGWNSDACNTATADYNLEVEELLQSPIQIPPRFEQPIPTPVVLTNEPDCQDCSNMKIVQVGAVFITTMLLLSYLNSFL